jgi:hypothetical protein
MISTGQVDSRFPSERSRYPLPISGIDVATANPLREPCFRNQRQHVSLRSGYRDNKVASLGQRSALTADSRQKHWIKVKNRIQLSVERAKADQIRQSGKCELGRLTRTLVKVERLTRKAKISAQKPKKAGRDWHHHSRALHRRSMGQGG